MARFRAYYSDSDEEHEDTAAASTPPATTRHRNADDRMDEDELRTSPQRRPAHAIRASEPSEAEEEDGAEGEYDEEEEDEEEDDEEVSGSESDSASASSSDHSATRPSRQSTEPNIIPWAQTIGIDAQKMHVMQTSLFRMPEEAAAAAKSRPQPTLQSSRLALGLPSTVNRKHSRDSEGDGFRVTVQDRVSFGQDMDPGPYRPIRKYARVQQSASIATGHEADLVDSGLALGRSFRVGWGPGGTLVHVGRLCAPNSSVSSTSNTSVVLKTTVPLLSASQDEESERIARLLAHHLRHSPIRPDDDGVPFASPSRSLNFSSFATLFPPADQSQEANLFRLGQALFDKITLGLSRSISIDMRNTIAALRRKTALSDWLEMVTKQTIDIELKNQRSGEPGDMLFTLLTGHQIEKACEAAIDSGHVKLASLLAQAGGDDAFRADLQAQLQLWREQSIDPHIKEGVRRTYALLAGVTDILEGSKGRDLERCPDVELAKGLDWKRALGLQLWYASHVDTPVAESLSYYEALYKDSPQRTAPPTPWYLETKASSLPSPATTLWTLPRPTSSKCPSDALFSLMKLSAEPALSLSSVLTPLSFFPTPLDYRLPWHLYILLSRCMRQRDLADRGTLRGLEDRELVEDDPSVEGHSPSADLLTNSYALQLEQMGMVQEAAFVLLHIEGSAGRRKALKDLLERSAPLLDEWVVHGLVGSLRLPMAWVQEAKAMYALYNKDVYGAYCLFMEAGQYHTAHELAVLELAPDAVIHEDLDLLAKLFEGMDSLEVDSWSLRGKTFLDYARIVKRVPELRASVDHNSVPDATEASEMDEIARTIPRLIGVLPDVLRDRADPRHNVAVAEMISKLMLCMQTIKPLAIPPMGQSGQPNFVSQTTRLKHVEATARHNFLASVDATVKVA